MLNEKVTAGAANISPLRDSPVPIQTVAISVSLINAYTQSSGMVNAGLTDIFNTGNASGVTNASPTVYILPCIA
jgi:hypothetical protein